MTKEDQLEDKTNEESTTSVKEMIQCRNECLIEREREERGIVLC